MRFEPSQSAGEANGSLAVKEDVQPLPGVKYHQSLL
jgi:hypothetical protein